MSIYYTFYLEPNSKFIWPLNELECFVGIYLPESLRSYAFKYVKSNTHEFLLFLC